MLIVLEGLPGAGKTTVLKHLRAHGVSVIDELVMHEPDQGDENFFLENDRQKYKCISDENVVMDRNFVSTLCFNGAYDTVFHTRRLPSIAETIEHDQAAEALWHPDLYVWLRCTPATSLRRQNKTNDSIWKNKQFLQAVRREYERYFTQHSCPYVEIDTNDRDSDDVVACIMEILNNINQPKEVVYER